MNQIKSYIQFLWHSKNEHGVHSPFVFDLVTKCFYDNSKKEAYPVLRNYRKALLRNTNTIEVTDFGAGSKVFRSNTRQIAKIAQTAGITPKRAELLYRVARYFQPQSVLEIGTSLGMATAALSLGNETAKITTVEGCKNTSAVAQNQFEAFDLNNIEAVTAEFSTYLETAAKSCNWDLIYFDGNHSKKATLAYFDLLLPGATNDSVWIFDDIHWSAEMEEAWETIRKNPKVTVTIDTFQWGFVFFRAEQQKEDFVIRP